MALLLSLQVRKAISRTTYCPVLYPMAITQPLESICNL